MVIALLILRAIVQIYLVLLIPRIVLDFVQIFARSWRPRGFALVVVELLYSVTDPPIKLVRRFLKPVRFGPGALDLSFMVVALGGWLLSWFLTVLIYWAS